MGSVPVKGILLGKVLLNDSARKVPVGQGQARESENPYQGSNQPSTRYTVIGAHRTQEHHRKGPHRKINGSDQSCIGDVPRNRLNPGLRLGKRLGRKVLLLADLLEELRNLIAGLNLPRPAIREPELLLAEEE